MRYKQWNCNRCGAPCYGNPWVAVVMQINKETGNPVRLALLSARMQKAARMMLCKDCATAITSYTMGED